MKEHTLKHLTEKFGNLLPPTALQGLADFYEKTEPQAVLYAKQDAEVSRMFLVNEVDRVSSHDIYSLMILAVDTYDEPWFNELAEQYNILKENEEEARNELGFTGLVI